MAIILVLIISSWYFTSIILSGLESLILYYKPDSLDNSSFPHYFKFISKTNNDLFLNKIVSAANGSGVDLLLIC
jgi:hypothetical protein